MGKIIFNRGFDKAIKKGTTASPTITEVSTTIESITFNLTNNDSAEATVYYDLDSIAELDTDNVVLAPAAISDDITISGLDLDTEYNVFAVASAVGKRFSPETSLAITTDEEPPFGTFELLYDSFTADNGNPISLPTTQIDITGLSISKDDELRMVYTLVGATAIETDLFVNDNNTQSNYSQQMLNGNGTSISGFRSNQAFLTFNSTTNKSSGFVDIKVSNNDKFVAQNQFVAFAGAQSSSIQVRTNNIVGNTFTLTTINKLTVRTNVTNGIAAGSRIRLYKVNTGAA